MDSSVSSGVNSDSEAENLSSANNEETFLSESLTITDTDALNDNNNSNEISDNANIDNSNKCEFVDATSVDITPEKNGGVLKRIIKEGEGEDNPGYGDKVSVHYTGWLLGTKEPSTFDTSRNGDKFEFNLGRGMVIKGWDLGISTMKKGEISLFICHPKYAYGEMGYPPTIPPHTPLLFEIELFEWKLDDLSPKKDESILRKVLDRGEGNIAPNEGSQMTVKITKYNDDEVLEEVEKDFILGEGCVANIPEGLELALFKFRLKERSLIYLRNRYAEEPKELSDSDASNSPGMKYEVFLANFEKAKEIWEMNSDEKFEKAKLSKEKGVTFYKMENYKLALKQFKWIVTCLEKEPGVAPENQESRKSLLLSGYLNIALCHLKLENFLDAVKVCDKALEIDFQNEKALFRRGQAKMQINDCEEALEDFEKLCSLNPDNKAARNSVIVCQDKIKKQKLKDKSTYNKMFEIFRKQDEERLKNMKTETGVWQDEEKKESECLNETQRLLKASNSALLDANVIEISNTANDNSSYNNV